uniref:Rab3 GTPase-activating protein catalytic subunit n=1 Tax=Haemonchus placei TaxID=6290 RepID=A0A0N4X3U2_HAEPC
LPQPSPNGTKDTRKSSKCVLFAMKLVCNLIKKRADPKDGDQHKIDLGGDAQSLWYSGSV